MASNLFNPLRDGENEVYRNLRDNDLQAEYKKKIEMLWGKYENLAPNNFLKDVQMDFYQHWWEMYLTVGLLNLSNVPGSGFNVETSEHNEGPDAKIICANGRCIWIEAVAPKMGDGKDSVPISELDTVGTLPEKELLLRCTNALDTKKEKFKDKYLYTQNDPCIVALSSCNLDIYSSLLNALCPFPLKFLVGCGNKVLKKNGSSNFSKRQSIAKISGGPVSVGMFENPEFDLISAVLYSSSDPLNAPSSPESTFQIFLNPLAKVPLPDRFYTYIETWHCEKGECKKIPAKTP